MAESFCHLHLHTDRSFLDGVGRSSEYAELAAEAGHPALAITDHGNLYGLPEHRRACKKVGIRPIFGIEQYLNDDRANSKGKRLTKDEKVAMDPTFVDSHLVTIAMDDEGWKNLLRINHDSVLNGYHYQARTDTDFVLRHSKGLIVTTACLGSQFGRYAASGDVAKLRALLGKYKDALGDRFYCEIHISELEQQRRVNAVLLREVSQLKVPTILTSDVHYACAGDARLQDEMIAVSRRVPVDDPNAFKVEARHLYYSGVEAAVRLNRDTKCGVPERLIREAAENTALLASRCTADIYPRDGALRPPRYINPQGVESTDPFGDLRAAVVEGFAKRVAPYTPKDQRHVYAERLKHEMAVIKKCGMSDFYLVTADIAREAEDRDIFLWTRGSGCASLVAAAIGITRVDPVRFGLLFERFVDPSRANAPDFDLDIDSTRRGELIEWFSAKYGGNNRERIARISSLSTFGLKSAIRDVCEMSGADMQAAFRISAVTDSLPPSVELSLAEAAPSERLAAFKSAEEEISKLAKPEDVQTFFVKHRQAAMDSLAMVGRVRGRTQHAAGYVVAPGPLVDYLPIDKIGSGDESAYVSAWGEGQAMQDIGETGLMKIDFLGLEACAIIAEAAMVIAEKTNRTIAQVFAELNGLAMDFSDPDVLREYAMGDGVGLHQLATQDRSLAKIVARLKPRSVADIAAAVSLYRPGSIAHVESFIDRARGKEAVPAVHPIVDEILKDTFGVMVYQEQVMKLVNQIGGIPLRKAYEIIKAISKKNLAKIKAAREEFIKGAILSRLDAADANRIFDDIENTASYSFNASHGTSYAVLSWITAYLRSKYPTEFWCALLNRTDNKAAEKNKKQTERKIEVVMKAASKAGIKLLPPTLAGSGGLWSITGPKTLLAPLSIIPGVGYEAAERIKAAWQREKWPRIMSFFAWADTNRKSANAKAIVGMACAGALCKAFPNQTINPSAARDLATYFAGSKKKSKLRDLEFAIKTDRASVLRTRNDPEIAISIERAGLGFNFWRSPWTLNDRLGKIDRMRDAGKIPQPGERSVNGKRWPFMLHGIHLHADRRGKIMAFLTLAEPEGESVKGVCFSSIWPDDPPKVGGVYLVSGSYDRKKGDFMVEKSGTSHGPFRDMDLIDF